MKITEIEGSAIYRQKLKYESCHCWALLLRRRPTIVLNLIAMRYGARLSRSIKEYICHTRNVNSEILNLFSWNGAPKNSQHHTNHIEGNAW